MVCFAPYGPVDGLLDGFELPDKSLVGTAFTVPHCVRAREDLDARHNETEEWEWSYLSSVFIGEASGWS